MPIRGVIFDLDGTLINTIEDIADSMNMVLEDLGREPLTYEEYKLKVGGGFRKLVASICPDLEAGAYDRALASLEESYRQNYMNKSRPYEGIGELLRILGEKGIKMGINTNKNQEYTDNLISKIFPDIDFVEKIGVDDRGYVKPDPTGARLVARAMGLEADELVYVGDSNVDMLTGENAGMLKIGVDWGFRGQEELRRYGADYIVYEPLEILDIIAKLK